MANCKDCIHYGICTFHITGNENEKCPHYTPAADVVPKSEPLFFTEEEIAKSLEDAGIVVSDKSIGEIKAEVAREIFEEIEKRSSMWGGERHIHNGIFAELKKKYTEVTT